MFSQACVKNFAYGEGNMSDWGGMCGWVGHTWQGVCVAEGMHGRGMCGEGMHGGGMCGRGHVWQGACVAGGMRGRGHA